MRGKWDYYPRHLFQAQLLRQAFPVAVPCLFLLAGQNGFSRDRKTEGQDGGIERWDKRAFDRDRMAKGQKGGTERLGQNVWDRRAGTEGPGQNV